MQMSPFFEQITTLVDIFRIYEPLVATSVGNTLCF